MRKTTLFYNPVAGRNRERRIANVEAADAVLREGGVKTLIEATLGSERTAGQVQKAIAEGCDTVIACGGDGTMHDVLQGVVGTEAALGVVPLGTANSLAKDLGLPLMPSVAASVLLRAKPRRLAAGQITCQKLNGESISRYFTVAAGIGVDAEVFQRFHGEKKNRLGHAGYYLEAAKLWLTHPMNRFAVKIKMNHENEWRDEKVSQVLAVRICNFGGLLRKLAPGASLEQKDLRIVLFQTRSRVAYLAHIVRGIIGAEWRIHGIELMNAEYLRCARISENVATVLVEADGELLGALPAEISIVADAFTLLMP